MKLHALKKFIVTGSYLLIWLSLTVNAQEVKDIDGNTYKTINSGKQTWTAGNLNVSHFRNGDIIPEARTNEEWIMAGTNGTPAWRSYENDPENGKKFGKLYNWYAINDPRGLAPAGWSIPVNADWSALVKSLHGVDVAGVRLKSTTGWKSKSGTDNIGFAALPGGYSEADGKFKALGTGGRWWSNSVPVEPKPSVQIYSLSINDNSTEVQYLKSDKGSGFSVRCIKK